jgi:biotin carboxyl carrier protein
MSQSAAQIWLESKIADHPEVSSALLLLEKNGALAQAATWPEKTSPEADLVVIANEAFKTNGTVRWRGDNTALASNAYEGPERRKSKRLVSRPLIRSGKLVGAMAFLLIDEELKPINDPFATSITASDVEPSRSQKKPTLTGSFTSASGTETKALNILQLVATALSKDSFNQASADVATELAKAFECDRVSIGLMNGRFSEVIAVSHSADIQPTPSLIQLFAAAMDEAVDQSASVQYPPLPHTADQITLSHAELANRHNIQQILTVAIMQDQSVLGAILFERRDMVPFSPENIELLSHLAATVGPVLQLKRDREHSWFARLKADCKQYWGRIFSKQGRMMRLAVLTGLAGMLALPMTPMQYSLNAPAKLEGISQRVMVAPTDGFLRSVSVRPGDMVKTGQVLAELADDDLRQERRRWESEVLRHDSFFGDALKRKDRAQMASAQASAAEARAQLTLSEQQIERTRLTAPFNGVVLKGDLKQQIGAPFKRGDTLLVLAPANEYRVMISVEDRAIESIRAGASGQLLLTSMPDTAIPLVIERILPVANAADGKNTFEVEARLKNSIDSLRPGMEGVAKIDAGDRSLYWMMGHRITDWFKLTIWAWTH